MARYSWRFAIDAPRPLNRTCIIINPAARGAKARLASLQKLARGVIIKTTRGPGDAEAQAERAVEQGYETIVAAGGDGTVNEVVNGIGTAPVRLGILPMGTVNVFALELGIPFGVEAAWKVVRGRHVRAIDLATANGHFFVQMAGIGFDAQVVKENNRAVKSVIGPLSYLLTATKVAVSKPPRLRVLTHGKTVAEGSFVLVGNGRYYGGPFALFKDADPADGLLDVCVFKGSDPVSIFRYMRGTLFGSVSTFSDVHYFKTKNLTVEADREVPLEVDGEVVGHSPVKFSVKHRKLHVLTPAK
jgi:diacylglycerol kinase (ATP)